MRYKDLVEQTESNKTFFHVTTKARVNSIMQHGIVSQGHHRRWKNMFGSQLGKRGYVYLFSDYTAAVKWAAKMDYDLSEKGKRKQQIVILCLRGLPEDRLEPDPNLEGQLHAPGAWLQLEGTIPPESVARVIPLTPDMVKQVVHYTSHGTPIELPPEESPIS